MPISNYPKLAVSGILRRSDRTYLLGKRAAKDTQGGKWVTPGGGVEFGEELFAAIAREFKEEVGLAVHIHPRFTSIQQRICDGKHIVMVFKQVVAIAPAHLIEPKPSAELVEVGWFTFDEIQAMYAAGEVTEMTYHALLSFITLHS